MGRMIPVLAIFLLSACSTSRRMQREFDRRVAETGTLLLARTDSTEAYTGEERKRLEQETIQAVEQSALWQLREEYSAPDPSGRQYRTARTVTRAGRSTATERRTASADSASRSTAETGKRHEYDYGNHWRQERQQEEAEQRRETSPWWRWALLGAAAAAAVYMAVKLHLNRNRK